MITFTDYIETINLDKLKQLSHCTDSSIVEKYFNGNFHLLAPELFALLCSPAAGNFLETMAQKASALTAQRHGRVIRFYAPLYISNECTNTCTYCGFTMENKISRKSLDFDECRNEARYLEKRGFRHVLLVSGEHQKIVTPEYIGSMVEACRPHFPSISIEVAPFEQKAYEVLVAKGVDG